MLKGIPGLKKKLILILITIASLIAIAGVALAINGDWFTFIENMSGIDESDRRAVSEFILTDLPEYFTAGVVIEGSNYTGQLHTVDISIGHNRPNDSVNIASGGYSLDMELSGEVKENIALGSFTGLRNTAPFVAPSQSWTPSSPAATYDIVFSLNNIVWTLLPEYMIISSAGEHGSIDPLGPTNVLEGDDLTFTITADEGYVIDEILVNEAYVMNFDPYVFDYPFENVQNDWAIHATFIEEMGTYSETNTALELGSGDLNCWKGTIETCTFNGETDLSIVEGQIVELIVTVADDGTYAGYTWSYHFEAKRPDGILHNTLGSTIGEPLGDSPQQATVYSSSQAGIWHVIFIVDSVVPP